MSMIAGIFAITLPIVIIIFIITAIIRSVRKDPNEESFQEIIRTMYIYVVMIIFLIFFVSGTVALFNSCLNLLLPETVQTAYNSTVTANNRAIADITTNIAILCISIPMFIYYSTIAKKEHKKEEVKVTETK